MRSLNWSSIQSSGDGDFTPLPAGPYVVRIVEMKDVESKEYVDVIWDIHEGEHANHYSDDWGKSHPYAHHVAFSYKDKALGMLKGRLEAIQASNPGFDPFAAWDAGRLDMFVNRLMGINLQEEEYEGQNGVRTRLNVCQVVNVQKVRDGKVRVRQKKTLDGGTAQSSSSSSTTDVYDGDIPFPV